MIARQTTRMREQARTDQQTIGASGPIGSGWVFRGGILGPEVWIESIQRPPEVDPGEPVDIDVVAANSRSGNGPFEPDDCQVEANNIVGTRNGVNVEATATAGWSGASDTKAVCVSSNLGGTTTETLNFSFTAPEQGDQTISVQVSAQTPERGDSNTETYNVYVRPEGSGDENGDDDSNFPGDDDGWRENPTDPSDGDGNDDSDGVDGDNPQVPGIPQIGTTQALAIGGGLTLFLVVVLALRP